MKVSLFLILLLTCIPGLNAWAADVSAKDWDKRFTLTGGAIAYTMNGDFSSTREGHPKIKLDLDDLDLDENKLSYFLGATVRLAERWRLNLDYFRYHDKSSTTVDKYFEFDDLIVNVGGSVKSKLNIDLYVINLGYDIYRSERARFGVGIGAHVADFDLEVTSNLNVTQNNIGSITESEDLTAPLPNLYAGGLYAFRNDLLFRYGAGWMSMSYGDYDGELVFAQGAMEYWPYKHVGLGAGYVYRSADIEYTTNNKKETYDIEMPGPVFYLTVGF